MGHGADLERRSLAVVALATLISWRARAHESEKGFKTTGSLLNNLAVDSKKFRVAEFEQDVIVSIPPPQGLTEVDYEAIEAAVTETVRGRWFLNEFARRNRSAEMRVLLDAMGRIETRLDPQPALPSADPSVRMLIQRIKEIAGQLEGLSDEMRDESVEERFVEAVALQARAVSGMMRGGQASRPGAVPARRPVEPTRDSLEPKKPPTVRMPRANLPASLASRSDPRLDALSGLDNLTLAKKLALFA